MTNKKLYTFKDLATKYGKDATYIARMVKHYKIKATHTVQDSYPCQALTLSEKIRLEKKNPNLTLPLMLKSEREVNDVAALRKQDVSGLLKFLKANDFVLEKRLHPEGGRPVNVLSAKEFKRLSNDFPVKPKAKK